LEFDLLDIIHPMKAAFFDIDGTLVSGFSGVSFFEFLANKNKFRKKNRDGLVKAVKQYKVSKITYEQLAVIWGQEIASGLKGQKRTEIYGLSSEFWQYVKPKFAVWAKKLISLFNSHQFNTIAISGSPIELLNLYKEKLDFQNVYATTVETKNDIYTGKLIINLVLGKEKEMIVNNVVIKDHIDLKESFGFGDNEHDRAFLDKVGHPIVISSESSLKHFAKKQGWPIFNFSDDVFEKVKALL